MSGSHPIDVDLERILPLLAREIYTSPFAFLRENVQNAFDAIRIQQYRDRAAGLYRDHRIEIFINDELVSITDTGIGMTREDLGNFFWSIGKSGKHTPEARSAGVVGTFGIGGMANFGVCTRLDIMTRPHNSDLTTVTYAERERLSAKEDCVFYTASTADEPFGTTVRGTLKSPIDPTEAVGYLRPIVRYVSIPVVLNGQLISQEPFPIVKRSDAFERVIESGSLRGRVMLRALQTGQAEVQIDEIAWNQVSTDAIAVLSSQMSSITAYQHGFMLAGVPLPTTFGLGGVINSSVLRPTAGREAVTDESRTFAQAVLAAAELSLAEYIAVTHGLPERFSAFFRFIANTGRLDLAAGATIRIFGSPQRVALGSLRSHGAGRVFFSRDGHDQAILQAYSEQGKVVALLSSDPHRQKVEQRYLSRLCEAVPLEDRVTCLRVVDDLPFPQAALRYQIQDRLRSQFLIDSISVQAGDLSHGAMLWAPPHEGKNGKRTLFVDFRHNQLQRLVELRESFGFDPVLDVFIRDSVLPHLETSFPDLKKRDFDALLRKLQSSVEYFEIDPSDISRIRQLAEITNMSPEEVAAVFGGARPRTPRPTSVGRKDIGSVTQQVNQVVLSGPDRPVEQIRQDLALRLLATDLDAKILDATEAHARLGLARYYVALTPDAHVLYRRVFLERRPAIDFSWGGHRAGYLFYSAGNSVIYYDIQFDRLVESTDDQRAGSLTIETEALVLRNNVFVPIPRHFEAYLVPLQHPLKFTIRHQILGVAAHAAL